MNRLFPRSVLLLLLPMMLVMSGCGRNLMDHLSSPTGGFISILVIVVAVVALIDLLGDRGRGPGSKIIWALIIIFMPLLGAILYFFLGR
ncbi:MAG: PLD nuclease N-terminal domain-containing protein [Longimonas sp.]|uniref:PLD nuclease N-terminal domain-containing protein n=1 Tax=Longimonas sp. TaxID=2039626 RepID=UPI00334BDF88